MHLLKKHTRGTGMQGVKVCRPAQFRKLAARQRTVARPSGGVLTATEVKERIMKAFLIEEFRAFKNMKAAGDKKDKKKKAKKSKKGASNGTGLS